MTLNTLRRVRNALVVLTVACYSVGCSQLPNESKLFADSSHNLIKVLVGLLTN